MDEHTLKILEFDKVRALVDGYLPSSLGRERVQALAPSTDRDAIEAAQSLVAEMVACVAADRTPPLNDLGDIRADVRRAKTDAMLAAAQIREIAATLIGLRRLREFLSAVGSDAPRLHELSFSIHDLSRLAYDIEANIDPGGRVVDSASRELARLRLEIGKLDDRVRAFLQRLLRRESIKRVLSYPNFTVSGTHYVLPVARDHRHDVPGVVHRASASGDTLFIEPAEVAELSTEIALLHSHETKEVQRILRQLSGAVGHHARQILESVEVGAELCFVLAKARFARAFACVRPRFSDGGRLRIADARHPVLEQVVRSQGRATDGPHPNPLPEGEGTRLSSSVVPISVHLGEQFDALVITGPNTGGKTVTLKTVGLVACMAQAGLPIPAADGSVLPVFDQVLADIGDEQSIEQSLSTFSSHVSHIAAILKRADARSLVLLDEIGAGTDPAEGAALARAILDELLRRGAKAIVTTHLGDLKLYALAHARVENAAVEFDTETLRPTYRLSIGDTGQSSALVIARRLDLPAEVVDHAERYLEASRAGRPQEIEVLEQRRAEAESARAAAWQAEQEARRRQEHFESRLRALDSDAADARSLEEFRARLQVGDTVHVRKFRRPGMVVRVDAKRRTATVSHGSMQWELTFDELMPPVAENLKSEI